MTIPALSDLKIKLFADGADLAGMVEMASKDHIQGLTTNPTLMKKVGISDYKSFALDVLKQIPSKPISFEVFSDELDEMKRQGVEIAGWGTNVYVKIPVTNTQGISTAPVIKFLVDHQVKVNVTALMTLEQVEQVSRVLSPEIASYISIFAGRIADTGRNPVPIMERAIDHVAELGLCEIIWASPRELLNVFQADEINCHIITATNDILKKLELVGHDLEKYSLETVQMFRNDAVAAGFKL
jgi:transaldolase